ncbi:hypothetical protein CDD81_75 [Ophiocordyceps australis]|uniref:Importin N-terminal domain-containing protein n=1 Tax=Ophiocordyceps australis TaxID=1399860 RepID=A0A2C5YI63_9HYPO|nr:hypothetical protein CDD81_75 [Ophiocordyceps australis]
MSFAIEVSGDANPLTAEGLCTVLESATSTNPVQRQAATGQLTAWEQQPGYYSSLQTVYLSKSLPLQVRFLAVIQLKNGIDKNWRLYSTIKNSISPDEKKLIRSRLFQGTIDEPERSLALHNALVAAKVIRIDYPKDWPSAFSEIIGFMRSTRGTNQRHLHGTLLVLLRVVKELCTARLKRSQTSLQSVTPELVYILSEIYSEQSNLWLSFLSARRTNDDNISLSLLNSLLALKLLRRLIIVGYARPHTDQSVDKFWALTQNQFGHFLSLVDSDGDMPHNYDDLIGKHLLQFTKFHIEMADQNVASFATLPNSLSLVHAYWNLIDRFSQSFTQSGGIRQESGASGTNKAKILGPLPERLALKGLLLLRACARAAFQRIATLKYRTPEVKAEQEAAQKIIKNELFKDEFVLQVVNVIITHFFVFRRSDLQAWEEDAEEWEQQEQSEGNAWEWEVRPCAEKLFLDLLINFRQLLIPPLLDYFKTAQDPQAEIDRKEAAYTTLGLAAAHVCEVFDFDSLLTSTLVQDSQRQGNLQKVLRRRIAILISQWAPVKMTNESRPLVYQIYEHFLNPGDDNNDLVVRITTARQLRWIADELGFNIEAFLPFAPNIFMQLIETVQGLELDETKLAILESLRILVMRLENHVSQFGDQLMSTLPKLWETTGSDEYMIKQAIIAIIAALVTSMGEEAKRYHSFIIPLLSEAARPNSDLHMHLIDESLELWNNILVQSSAPLAPGLMGLAHMAIPLLGYPTETASQALSAIEAYIVMDPAAMLEDGLRRPILAALSDCLDSKSRDQVCVGTICIEYMIRAATDLGGSTGISVVMQDMIAIGMLEKMMRQLREVWESGQASGPEKKSHELNVASEGDFFAILARLALADPHIFMQGLGALGNQQEIWEWLSNEWFLYVSNADHAERLKLYMLALTRFIELGSPMKELVLGRLQDYFNMWANVIMELQDGVVDGTDSLIWGELEASEYDTAKIVAERRMTERDPVHSVHALGFVEPRLQDLVTRAGGEAVFQEQWAVNVDRDVLAKYEELAKSMRKT